MLINILWLAGLVIATIGLSWVADFFWPEKWDDYNG